MTVAVEVRGLGKRFPLCPERNCSLKQRLLARAPAPASYDALADVSFTAARGEVLGFIGANGAGKSTLLKLIAGIYYPTAGSVTVHGRLSTLLELGAGFCAELSGRRNIHLNASLFGYSNREIARLAPAIIEFAELQAWIDEPLKHYSSGMMLRLGFAIAAHLDHEILLMDEVMAVGDFAFQEKCVRRVDELARRGTTILAAAHDLPQLARLCGRIMHLDRGRPVVCADPATAIASYRPPPPA